MTARGKSKSEPLVSYERGPPPTQLTCVAKNQQQLLTTKRFVHERVWCLTTMKSDPIIDLGQCFDNVFMFLHFATMIAKHLRHTDMQTYIHCCAEIRGGLFLRVITGFGVAHAIRSPLSFGAGVLDLVRVLLCRAAEVVKGRHTE